MRGRRDVDHQAFHPAREAHGVRGGARLHYGDVSGGPCGGVRGKAWCGVHCVQARDSAYGMNRFLKHLSITFRRDPNNFRPRINKQDSQKDKEQKASGNYFFMEDWGVC